MTDAEPADRRETFRADLDWRSSGAWAVCLLLGYLVLACLPVVLALAARPGSDEPLLEELGMGAALLGFAMLALQPLLAGRFHWADRPVGHDALVRFHQGAAVLAAILLTAHPLLLSAGEGNWRLLTFDTSWQVWLGKTALLLLLLGAAYAVLAHATRLQYQTWRRAHKGMVVVVILGFLHSVLLGHDFEEPMVLVYWSALFAVAAGVFLWRNVAVCLWARRRFRVADVHQGSHDTYTVRLEPADGKPLPARNPGQFMFLTLLRPGRKSEEHPFTISASPTEGGSLAATIKQSGDFTDTIGQTSPGDEARVEHPFGRFSHVHHRPEKLVFLAGGVGITPIRSMLRCLADSGDTRPAVLIYGNKAEGDILFREELDALGANVRVVHVLSEPDENWDGESGYVTREIIERHAGELLGEADVYLCGPPAMMDMLLDALGELGVPGARIHAERFSL